MPTLCILWELIWESIPLIDRACFLGVLHCLWFLQFFHLLFHRAPWLFRRRIWWGYPFRNECSKVSDSAYCLPMSFFFISTARMMAEQGTNLLRKQKGIRSHFIATFLLLNSSIWFNPGCLSYLVSGSWSPKQDLNGSILWGGPLIKSDIGWLLTQDLCHTHTRLSCRQDTIVDRRVCSWITFVAIYISLW